MSARQLRDIAPEARPFNWTIAKEKAAQLVARDELTEAEIAGQVGVSERALQQWKAHPDFAARVDSHVAEYRRRYRARGIAVVENRVKRLEDRCRRMDLIIQERGDDPTMAAAKGGKSGLLVRDFKMVRSGNAARVVQVYTLDAALLRELREHEKQVAQELGQWKDKQEITGAGGGPIELNARLQVDWSGFTDEEIQRFVEACGVGARRADAPGRN